jgi:hypothetical protein
MTMDEDETESRRHWWEVLAAAIETPWPRPSLKDRGAWVDQVATLSAPVSAVGLREGLIAALDVGAREYVVETEQQLLWLGIYFLTDMVKAGDEQLLWLVAEARHKGLSWTEIGSALGISKQAAHKRFADQVNRAVSLRGGM